MPDRLPTVFAFFGIPGAGKSTLCARFRELTGCPAFDTDTFMTGAEVAAVESGVYTQDMRLANIRRYCAHARRLLRMSPCVALADGLPNDEAREHLRGQFAEAVVVFVLVQAPPGLWESRLSARSGSPVDIDVRRAREYIAANWHEPVPALGHAVVENGADRRQIDAELLDLYHRHVPA